MTFSEFPFIFCFFYCNINKKAIAQPQATFSNQQQLDSMMSHPRECTLLCCGDAITGHEEEEATQHTDKSMFHLDVLSILCGLK